MGIGLCADVDEDATIDTGTDMIGGSVGDGAADTVNFIAADLASGDPWLGGAEAEGGFGSLRGLNFHKAGDGAEIGDDGDGVMMDLESIEAERDTSAGAWCGFCDGDDGARNRSAFGDFFMIGKRNILHDARGDDLAGRGGFRRESVIQADGENGARRDLKGVGGGSLRVGDWLVEDE